MLVLVHIFPRSKCRSEHPHLSLSPRRPKTHRSFWRPLTSLALNGARCINSKRNSFIAFAEDFAAKAPDGANYMRNEPSELTEQMWGTVLRNNRAFHGYHIENVKGHNTPIKAPKPGKSPFGRSCLYFGRSSSCDTDYLLSIT